MIHGSDRNSVTSL